MFRPDRTFTLWGAEGTWKVLSPTKFEIIYFGEGETYEFLNWDPINAICIDHESDHPMRIVMDNSLRDEQADAVL